MSLLEDVFLEDEAGEAQELERVIEGDEYDERPLSPNSDDNEEKDDEAEEDKRRVDPTQAKATRVVKNPRFILNPARLTGPRGIQVIPDHFKDFKFKGKGHEKEDLDMVLKKLEHWAYRLYPKFGFHDSLKKIEMLGKKRQVAVHLQKIRSDQFQSEAIVQKDSESEAEGGAEAEAAEPDEFDKLLQQQIDLARATPTPGPPTARNTTIGTPAVDRSLMMPKATSSPSISEEQRERMLRNRRLAEEKKLAKLKNENPAGETPNHEVIPPEVTEEVTDEVVVRKHNRSHVIDSSDDEEPTVNRSVAAEVHSIADKEIDNVKIPEQNSLKVISEHHVNEVVAQKHNSLNAIDNYNEEPVDNESIAVNVLEKSHHEICEVELNYEDEENVTKQNCIQVETNLVSEEVTDEVVAGKKRSTIIDVDRGSVNRSISDDAHNDVEISNRNKDKLTEEKYCNTTKNTGDANNLITDEESDNLDNVNILMSSKISKNENQNEHVTTSGTNGLDMVVELQCVNNKIMETNDKPKSKAENVDIIDDVMDVDFSEDF